jgi:hypothetical protein
MYDSFFDELVKLAQEEEGLKTKAMRGVVKAKPWAQRFATSAIPSAVAANFLLPFGGSPAKDAIKRRLVAGAGLLGGAAGVGALATERWAKHHPREGLAKEIQKEGTANLFLKVAAMAADLREKGIGGVPRPPMVTEDSKQQAYNKLETSSKPGEFLNSTKPKHLRAPGPSIKQVSALPTG